MVFPGNSIRKTVDILGKILGTIYGYVLNNTDIDILYGKLQYIGVAVPEGRDLVQDWVTHVNTAKR